MSPEEFVVKYMALVDAFAAMDQGDRERLVVAFEEHRARQATLIERFLGRPA